jgi:CHAT domain-containing protein
MTLRALSSRIAMLLTLGFAFISMLASPAWAQDEDITASFRKLTIAQEQQQREVLAQAVPPNASPTALTKYFQDKERAALMLADHVQHEAVLREAIRLLPQSSIFQSNLANRLLSRGEFVEGNAMRQQALANNKNVFSHVHLLATATRDDYAQFNNAKTLQSIEAVNARVAELTPTARLAGEHILLLRASCRAAQVQSLLYNRLGKYDAAVTAAEAAEQHAKKALSLVTKDTNALTVHFIHQEIADAVSRKLAAYQRVQRFDEAEKALTQYIRYAREVQLPANYLSGMYASASTLRFAQREFVAAEKLARLADEVLEKQGVDALHIARLDSAMPIWMAMAAQKRWSEALEMLEKVDALVAHDAKLKTRVLNRFNRGVVYLGNGRFVQAAPLFERLAQQNRDLFGEHHFFTAQSAGLQGAALWRSGTKTHKAKALPLLKQAVQDYMDVANADYLQNVGLRKELREQVFAAYLDAVTTTPGEDPTQAMGPADWVRGSVVQDALADAAVRSAVSTPALAKVVRLEQDAKNEIAGLRGALSGEGGSAADPLPEVASQMRARIAQLEAQRKTWQADIKAKFPQYEVLVRPLPPNLQAVARELGPSQALLMALPTPDAVYVWAVASDRPARFARVKLPESEVNQLVERLRNQLDFAKMRSAPKRYDSEAAFTLYDQLLAPVAPAWKGKAQLIVATAGALSQLPFAVLHTSKEGGADAKAPWLIAQIAITQVPSLSAWMAIKGIAKQPSAPEAFVGWADPVFSIQASATATLPAANRSVALNRGKFLTQDLDDPKDARLEAILRYADMPPLPDTRDELRAIAKILSANASDVIVGQRATRESVISASMNGVLARKRVVAFATHGLMAGDFPQLNQPALAMSIGSNSSEPLAPLLTLEDVLTLKLNADWVVLSACNTAAADGKAEEALSGLARGFFYAGSRSLLVTHWSVESESATLLTTATFEHYIKNPQAPKAESLRQAMLKVMAMPKYGHPAYWAPYALVGDGGR